MRQEPLDAADQLPLLGARLHFGAVGFRKIILRAPCQPADRIARTASEVGADPRAVICGVVEECRLVAAREIAPGGDVQPPRPAVGAEAPETRVQHPDADAPSGKVQRIERPGHRLPHGARIGPGVVRGPRPAHLAHEVPRTVGGKSRKKQPKQFFHVTGPFRSRGSARRTW